MPTTSTGSVTLTAGYHVPQGKQVHIYISEENVDVRPNPVFNYIATYTPRKPGITNPSVSSLSVNDVAVDIQYFDELGRKLQDVQAKATPSLQDVVQPYFYDIAGRQAVKPLPYVDIFARPFSIHGAMHYYAQNTYFLFYDSYLLPGITANPKPFTQYRYDNSALDRVVEEGPPGEDWRITSSSSETGHTIRTGYSGNGSGVARYGVAINATTGDRTLTRAGNNAIYNNSELSVVTVKDENWTATDVNAGTVQTFTDKDGRVVLTRQHNRNGTNVETHSTYYVYDDFGNLCFVLPPNANPDQHVAIAQTTLDHVCYQYRYDGRQRLTERRLPGKGWEYFVYNRIDQVIMTQDAVQRGKVPQQWSCMRYDVQGRLVLTGIFNHTGTSANTNHRAALQTNANQHAAQWESRIATGNGYSSVTYPTSLSSVLTIQYYDDYDFPGGNPYAYAQGSKQTRGLLTGKRVNVLNTSHMLWHVLYYDQEGRMVKEFKQHYKDGSAVAGNVDEVSSSYNFTGDMLSSRRVHKVAGVQSLDYLSEFAYDHRSRLTDTWEQINGQAKVKVANHEYNELGQLVKKRLHFLDNFSPIQTLTHAYHPRGWLKSVSAPKFSYAIDYEGGANPQYNGNLSGFSYTGDHSGSRSFSYTYDKLNRLKGSTYSQAGQLNETLDYDKVGNITSLARGGTGHGTLTYTYQNGGVSNRLASIAGYHAGSYTYDANGNMLNDGPRGVTLTYNHLNLPASFGGTQSGSYTYDAEGRKLRSVLGGVVREYIDGIHYKAGTLEFVATAEGRAENSGGTFTYQYNLTDHLGNVRVTFDNDNRAARVIQEDEYYAFGLNRLKFSHSSTNMYLYNGKELQEGLRYFDYGARFYDPVVGRWGTVDPLAEQMRRWSPYNYAFDNPIRFIDPDGQRPVQKDPPGWFKNAYNAWTRLVTGTSGSAANDAAPNLSPQTKSINKALGVASDVQDVASAAGPYALEAAAVAGEGLEVVGAATTAAGYVLAPVTEGASLALVPIGTAMELTGTGLQIPKMVAEGDNTRIIYTVGSTVFFNEVGKVINKTESAGKITKTDNTILNAINEMWNKTADFIFNRANEDEQNKNR